MTSTPNMQPINVGLLGIGTVGSGTFEVLARNQEEIMRRAGRGIVIKMVADTDLERARKGLTHPIMFDGRNLFDPQEMEKLGWIYKSVGR